MKPSKIASAALAVLLLAAPALAGEKSVLAPGKPAGAKQAAMAADLSPFLYVGLFAAAAAIIAVTAGQGGTDSITVTSTGTAP
ncbi:MAG TPA: hypothetical protein VJ798_01130 [Rhizomicrobium sp.]|nr:hypothetical protein [Rhizomicrobium sp.]